jgi:O-antigen/teichoic acid export membrane protein
MAALTNATGMLFCRVAADGLNVVLFIVISRLFGPEGVGVYSYGFAVATLVYAMTVLGIEQYATREYQHSSPAQRSRLIGELLGLQLCVGVLMLVVLALYLLITAPDADTALIVGALSTYQLCSAVAATLFVPAMAQQEMLAPSVFTLVARGGAFVVATFSVWILKSPLSLALLAFALAGFVLVGCAAGLARKHLGELRIKIELSTLARTYRAMWSFATAEMFGQFLSRVGVIVLSLLVGARAAGVYATGLKFIELFFLPLWFTGVALYPRLCQAFMHDRQSFSTLSARLLWLTSAMTVGIALAMYFIVPHLLVFMLGPQYAGTEAFIASMALIAVLYGPEMGLGRILFASRLNMNRARAVGLGAAASLALNLLLVPEFGVAGAIRATATAYLIVVLWYVLALRAAPASGELRQPTASSS